jgi:hypothetical protein
MTGMDPEQFDKLIASIHKIAAATLTATLVESMKKKMTLKEMQTAFNDCYMIVHPTPGTKEQTDFQERIEKRGW